MGLITLNQVQASQVDVIKLLTPENRKIHYYDIYIAGDYEEALNRIDGLSSELFLNLFERKLPYKIEGDDQVYQIN